MKDDNNTSSAPETKLRSPKLTKPQAALYERVKAGGLLMRHLSAAENRMAHRLKDMKLIALDGTISSRGPYNQAAQNDQVWVLYEDKYPSPQPKADT